MVAAVHADAIGRFSAVARCMRQAADARTSMAAGTWGLMTVA